MNLNEPLIAELRIEAMTTVQMFRRVPAERVDWRPDAKSRPLGELLRHIANIPGRFIASLDCDELCVADNVQPHSSMSPAEILEMNVARALVTLQAMTDARFLQPWRYRRKGQLVFELPRFVVARTAGLNHLIHHRGQLSVYLRLLGISLPPVYGPTADEAPGER